MKTMGILSRIKNRLPIVGGSPSQPARPAAAYEAAPTPRPAPPPPRSPEEVRAAIEQDVASHAVLLFMKGSARSPMCGFSASAAATLDQLGVDFETRDVLADPALRQGIKEYSDWPTIPQVYVGGEFVGGSDLLKELHESGELKTMIEAAVAG
jgi:monothiol glutaredoxin